MSGPCIDLFAGPGGIDLAATELGLDVLGIELDDDACATRQAVGLRTLQADVAALDPADFAPCWGLMGSPPCPTFSNAGNGCGRQVIDVILVCARELVAGRDTRPASIDEARLILEPICWAQEQAAAAKKGRDPDRVKSDAHASRDAAMSLLVVEPLRWALALRPRWIALEQVPPVLPIWEAIARMLRDQDYETWTGLLSAERFGVPQTRKRAFLLASLDGVVVPPRPTHQRYIAPRRKDDDEAVVGLFDEPPGRIVHREDRDLLPWVSMEDALGFGMTARPMTTLAPGTASGGPDAVGGSGARSLIERERERERPLGASRTGWRGARG